MACLLVPSGSRFLFPKSNSKQRRLIVSENDDVCPEEGRMRSYLPCAPAAGREKLRNCSRDRMWAALRYRSLNLLKSSAAWSQLRFPGLNQTFTSVSTLTKTNEGLLNLQEVEKVLSDVRADNVVVIPVRKQCDWTDFMVVATGRSTWHVKNIAQALIYKAKEKQKEIGAKRLMLPSVEGQETGKWVVIDSGKVIVHALDEKARAYYNLENIWTTEISRPEPIQDLEKAFVKVRRKNNSKKTSGEKSVV